MSEFSCPYCVRLQGKYPGAKLRECRHAEIDVFTPLHQPKKATTARVFIHPRCLQGPSSGALISCLQERGYDVNTMSIGPMDQRGYCELVRLRGTDPDGLMHLERMNGDGFDYMPVTPPTKGTAA